MKYMYFTYLTEHPFQAGESRAIELQFTASPQPRVTWKKNGETLIETRRLKVDSIYNMTSLVLGHAEKGDAGTYSLTLNNPHGTATLNVKVTVLGESFITTISLCTSMISL